MVQSIKYCLKQPLFWIYATIAVLAFSKQLFQESILVDSFEYLKKAHYIFDNWFEVNVHQERILEPLRRTIGYPLLIKALNYNHILIYILQFFVVLLIPMLLHRLVLIFNFYYKTWLISMLFLISFPLQFFYSAFIMTEIWVQFFLLLWVLAYFEGHKILMPLWMTMLILLKPVFIMFLLLPFLLSLKKLYQLSIFDLLPVLVFVSLSLFNNYQYGVFSYSSVGYTNAYDYNRKKYLIAKNSDENIVDFLYKKEDQEIGAYKQHDFKGIIEYLNGKTTPILIDPVYWWVHFKGVFVTFIDPGRYDAMVFLNWDKTSGFMGVNDGNTKKGIPLYQWIYIGVFAFFGILKFLFAGFAISQWNRYSQLQILTVLLFFIAFMAGPVGSARYLMPAYPFMAILCSIGFLSIRKQLFK